MTDVRTLSNIGYMNVQPHSISLDPKIPFPWFDTILPNGLESISNKLGDLPMSVVADNSTLRTSSEPLGGSDNAFGTSSEPLGGNDNALGTSSEPLGSNDNALGTRI